MIIAGSGSTIKYFYYYYI